MNLFGWDVRQLDVDGFLAWGRLAFLAGAVLWVALLLRLRRPAWLLGGVLLANAHAWFVTNWPLPQVVAAGLPIRRTCSRSLAGARRP